MSQADFEQHICDEYRKGRMAARKALRSRTASVGCVDGLTAKGDFNPPGGLLAFVFGRRSDRKRLTRYMRGRSGQDVTAHVHHNCGFLCVIQGHKRSQEHAADIRQGTRQLRSLARRHNVRLRVNIEPQGSAAPYMQPPHSHNPS